MSNQVFIPGLAYTKRDIYKILNVPKEKQRGAWDKGYREYEGNIFIFSNVGIPGRTGHDYNNYWDGDLFVWEAALKSHIKQGQIDRMINPKLDQKILLFTRTEDRSPFTFEGNVIVNQYVDSTPVKIIWKFEQYPYDSLNEIDVLTINENIEIYEGAFSNIRINKFERNPLARRICIKHYGAYCNVCGFDFQIVYGDLGKNYIHVHHIIPIASIGKEYKLVPETDLVPVCPNCHSMIHKQNPILSPDQLRKIITDNKSA